MCGKDQLATAHRKGPFMLIAVRPQPTIITTAQTAMMENTQAQQ